MADTEAEKRIAGEAAAGLAAPGMVVGLGTGSTARWFVVALARRALDIACVPTSRATARLAESLGLRLLAPEAVGRIDLTVDGADEIAPGLALLKGGGGALVRERLVWEASDRCVVVADSGKRVTALGAVPLPVEVVPFAHRTTAARIAAVVRACGLEAELRLRGGVEGPFVTDNGNLIYDAACGTIPDPEPLARSLKALTGVVGHGLFLGLANEALIGTAAGLRRLP
ncbi:ribose-5-phosphate isomerase RpiA [Roseomonas sp. OT10]|uniref:ribose-5-phosphate isomerase RpiA n=1 Tax=Roseomonas cutis TaxID=2897332 RepID=UPI001E63708B|nr:ribose-5-phosphate isomerase RpiA [Roseomonas sp. OT10]UFN50165.1 ribose-5-phosphate isomerase RpiA [Roseomonas sp. OT10]